MEINDHNVFPFSAAMFLIDAAFDFNVSRFYSLDSLSFASLRLILENTTLPDVSEAAEQNEGRVCTCHSMKGRV